MSDVLGRRRPVLIGSLVSVVGLFLMWGFAAGSMTIVLGALLALVGFGLGIAGSPRTTAALETIEPERVGMAAGTYLTGRYIGGALGATLAGAVLGGTVTAAGVTQGFGLLTLVAVAVAGVSLLLPGRVSVTRVAGGRVAVPSAAPSPTHDAGG
jgi:MFS family permease